MTTKELLEEYDNITKESNSERVLWNLLKANEKDIESLIEYDNTGYYFHKALRQIDVCKNEYIDMSIWLLLNDAPLFWGLINSKQ